jgi:hypothetical protein
MLPIGRVIPNPPLLSHLEDLDLGFPLEQHEWVGYSCSDAFIKVATHHTTIAQDEKSKLGFPWQPRLPKSLKTSRPPPAKDETTTTMPRGVALGVLMKREGPKVVCTLLSAGASTSATQA